MLKLRVSRICSGENRATAAFSGETSAILSTPIFAGQLDMLLNFLGLQQIEDADAQRIEQAIHRFQAETAAGVQKIGKMSLRKIGGASQTDSRQFSSPYAGADVCPELLLQILKGHVLSLEAIHLL